MENVLASRRFALTTYSFYLQWTACKSVTDEKRRTHRTRKNEQALLAPFLGMMGMRSYLPLRLLIVRFETILVYGRDD
jgi:hypothetical protein